MKYSEFGTEVIRIWDSTSRLQITSALWWGRIVEIVKQTNNNNKTDIIESKRRVHILNHFLRLAVNYLYQVFPVPSFADMSEHIKKVALSKEEDIVHKT